MIRVQVAARSSVNRAGLETIVSSRPGMEAAPSTAAGGRLQDPGDAPADVVLCMLESRDGVPDAIRSEDGPPVVLLAGEPQASWIRSEIGGRLRAVLSRDAAPETIAAAIEAAAAGLVALEPEGLRELLAAPRARARGSEAAGPLTPREIEVLRMMADGLPNKTIAWNLGISEHTVKFHLTSIFAKLGAASRTEAVTEGLRRGLILL